MDALKEAIKRRRGKSMDMFRGEFEEKLAAEEDDKLKSSDQVVIGDGPSEKVLSDQSQDKSTDELAPTKQEMTYSKKTAEEALGRKPFSRTDRDEEKSGNFDDQVFDEATYADMERSGKKPKTLFQKIQMKLGKKRNKMGDTNGSDE